jgi:hypothetical protein
MTALALAALILVGGLLSLAFGDLVSEELRGWLDLAPRAVLRLAAIQLRPGQRKIVYEEVWIPDLLYVLRGKESRPITRLIRGMWFAVGLLISARRGRYPDRTASNSKAPPATNEDVKRAEEAWESQRKAAPAAGSNQQSQAGGAAPRRPFNMQSGEYPMFTIRMHPVVLIRPVVLALIGLAIAGLLSGLQSNDTVLLIIWLAWVALVLNVTVRISIWSKRYFIATSQRMVLAKGFFTSKIDTLPISKITNMGLKRSIAGRVIGYGELTVESGGNEQSAKRFPYVPYPVKVYQALSRIIL